MATVYYDKSYGCFVEQRWLEEFEETKRDVLRIVSNRLNLADPFVSEAFATVALHVAKETPMLEYFGQSILDQMAHITLADTYYKRVGNLVAIVETRAALARDAWRSQAHAGTTIADGIVVD